jgi:PAS domain S-box-containing protein
LHPDEKIEFLKRQIERLEKSLEDSVAENERLREVVDAHCENAAIHQSMIDSSVDCIKTLDLQGHLLSMSRGGRKLLEIENIDPFLGQSWIDFWKNDDYHRAARAVQEARQGRIGAFEGYCATLSGRPKWWDVVVSPIYDEKGGVQSLLSVSRDITDKKLQALELNKVTRSLTERMKELRCLYELSRLVEDHDRIERILERFTTVLQKSFQHPEHTAVRITRGEQVFEAGHFSGTNVSLSFEIICESVSVGKIDVAVDSRTFGGKTDGFLKEEIDLMKVVRERLGHIIERIEKKQTFAALFDTFNEAILKADAEGFITEANQAAAELCGYDTPRKLIGSHMEKLYAYPETRNAIVEKLSKEGGLFHNFDFPLKRCDGTVLETSCNITLMRDGSGNVIGTLGALRDVTDIKQAERQLRQAHQEAVESREKYKRVFDNPCIMIIEVDAESFEILTCNEAMAKNLGRSPEHPVGANIKDILPEKVLRKRVKIGEKLLKTKKSHTFEDENNGKYFLNTFTPLFLEDRRVIQTVTIDITARKKIEMERDKLIKDLETALAQVKILSGLLPICSNCKKIRDDKGYWNYLESYISKNSDAVFTHSICPECAQKLYPEVDVYEE